MNSIRCHPAMQGDTLKDAMNYFFKTIKVWLRISFMAAQSQLTTFWAGLLFVTGKILRFLLFFVFLFSVLAKTKTLAGYSQEQVILFFLVFNLVDITSQILFRGVYRFRRLIISGDYDLVLVSPMPSFFRPIFGWSDIFDLTTLIPLIIYLFWFIFQNNLWNGSLTIILFILLFLNSLFLSFAFHLLVCSVCVLTTEIDHLVMVYRDLTNMARFPTDIYQKGIQFFLTFTIPVVILMTVPSKAILNLVSWQTVLLSFSITFVFLVVSFRLWKYAVRGYSSASS